MGTMRIVEVVFGLAGTAYPVSVGGLQGCVLFFVCINMIFVSIDRTDPEQQPQLSSRDTREVAALSLAHTL